MCLQLKLLDRFKLSNHVGVNFACEYSDDNRFFIINDVALYVLSFNGSVTNELPNFLSRKYTLIVSDFSPCLCVDIDINSFYFNLPKEDIYEIVMKVELSSNLKNTKPLDPVPLCAKWSPKGLADNSECFLGVLTNLYSLEIYMKYLNHLEEVKYCMISNITQSTIANEKVKWSDANRFANNIKLEEYKRRISAVTPSAFTWSHLINVRGINTCVIFVGHLNGDITAWRLRSRRYDEGKQSSPDFLGRYRTPLSRITYMQWHGTSKNGGGLFYSDIEGQMNVVNVTYLNTSEAVFVKECSFLTEKDKVKVEKISVFEYNEKTFILVAKQGVLIIFGINKMGDVFDCSVVYIQNYYITGLHYIENKVYVLSLPGILTELTVEVKDNKICTTKNIVSLKNDMEKYRTHGFFFTKTYILLVIIAYPWDLQSFSKSRSYVNVFVYHNVQLKPFDLLWNNQSDSMEDYWDCFETLRIVCIKEKRFPWLGLPSNLNYDTLSTTQLKTLRLVAQLSEMVFSVIPTVKTYDIKPFIILHYLVTIKLAIERMTRLFNKRKETKLSDFQMRSIFIQNFFLKEMVAKNILPKANVGKTFIDSMIEVMTIANELEYPEPLDCVWCGDKILGPVCFPPHVDSRCCISMMPIFVVAEYKCPYCKSLAHKQIEEEHSRIYCPYCDVLMERIVMADEQILEKCRLFEVETSKQKLDVCFADCLKEEIDVNEIEENDTEYIIFSDSDEESSDSMKELYNEFSKAGINDEDD
ncbi:uncharacterized protein LOC114337138 isoform X1 [Diabrotica virgifera virgifera]|uniref:Transcription factor IIIC 90kDa subunit N-terminal domain-containing protein n=1 Tax=Diabrotica virgifera virgifera TaxID=50390 RepID=A0ABM5IV78_DIAVI|nr:uncharacterized protein LOC114337138 isoform X1 [Diabrotica virgifera virgifera]